MKSQTLRLIGVLFAAALLIGLTLLVGVVFAAEPQQSGPTKLPELCNAERVTVALFTTETCGYCRKFKAEVLPDAKVQEKLKAVDFRQIDANKQYELANKAGVSGVPYNVAVGKDCTVIGRLVGLGPAAAYAEWLELVASAN